MSSKFFTWTKGDRRNAAESIRTGGFVNIGPEAGSYETDRFRSPKDTGKKQKQRSPLPLDKTPESKVEFGSSSGEAMPLHGAAIQSATSLLKAVDNMLRSPNSPMFMHPGDRGDSLAPLHGRPRSRTAPSTPFVEASAKEPVELPGSFPVGRFSCSALARSGDGEVAASKSSALLNVHGGSSMMRTYSSPNNCSLRPADFVAENGLSGMDLRSPTQAVARSAKNDPQFPDASQILEYDNVNVLQPHSTNLGSQRKRPPLPSLWTSQSAAFVPSVNNASQGNSAMSAQNESAETAQLLQPAQQNRELILIEQVSRLRASHESHIQSIGVAHEKELASQRAYIEFLESQRIPSTFAVGDEHQCGLKIDTSLSVPSCSDSRSAGISATSLQSSSSSGNSKKSSQETTTPTDSLKQIPSLSVNRQTDTYEQRQEREHLRDIAEVNERRVRQLKDIVRKHKENEKGLRNAVADLEGRLEHANNERLDVSEGYHEACRKISALSEREIGLRSDFEELQSNLARVSKHTGVAETVNHAKGRHNRTTSDTSTFPRNGGASTQQFQVTPYFVVDRNGARSGLSPPRSVTTHIHDREVGQHKRIQELEFQLAAAKSSADRLNSAFQAELRRQARRVGCGSPVHTGQTELEASKIATAKTARVLSVSRCASPGGGAASSSSSPEATAIAVLENELQHCIKELILSKMDIRSHKKSLHKAKVRMAELQLAATPRPPTPEWDSAMSAGAEDRNGAIFNTSTADAFPKVSDIFAGRETYDLGIASEVGETPTQEPHHKSLTTIKEGKSTSALAKTQRKMSSSVGVDKELPKTPDVGDNVSPKSVTTSPASHMQRTGTSRSVSESIISSYAKRETTKQVPHVKTSPCRTAASTQS